MVTFEQAPEEDKGGRHVDIWEKCIPGRGNYKCKGPEVVIYLVNLKAAES